MPIMVLGSGILVMGLILFIVTNKSVFLFVSGTGIGIVIGAILESIFLFT